MTEENKDQQIKPRCPECGLRYRSGNVEAHKKGPSHKRRVKEKKNES